MFGKKKESGVVTHYEGIEHFATNYPVRLDVKDGILEIKRMKPETTVTLPLNRINSFSALEEQQFMQQYHGNAKTTSKSGIGKYYLVIKYDNGMIALCGTAKEYRYFIDLQYHGLDEEAPKTKIGRAHV